MKQFHVDLHEDLTGFIKLCRTVADSGEPQPVFYVKLKEAVARIEEEGGLHVVRASVRYWASESPAFMAPLDTSTF